MITTISNRLPLQRLSYKQKMENKCEWGKSCVNALATAAHINYYNANPDKDNTKFASEYDRMLANYRLYNNQIDQADFERECDPLGLTPIEFRDVIQPYNKVYNKINTLVGEEWKRPFSYMSLLINEEASNQFTREKDRLVEEYLFGQLQSEIERIRMEEELKMETPDTEGMSEAEIEQVRQQRDKDIQDKIDKVLSPEQIQEYMTTKWRPAAEIAADKILRIVERTLNIKKQKNDGFKHLNISGVEAVWVGELNGNPHVELLNSLKLFYHKSPEVEYFQDGMYAGYLTRMSLTDIYQRLGNDLSEEDKSLLERYYTRTDSIKGDLIGKGYDNHGLNTSFEWRYMGQGTNSPITEGSYGFSTFEDIELLHCEWVSQRKVGFKTFTNEEGTEQLVMMDELFELPKNAKRVTYEDQNMNKKVKYLFEENGVMCEFEWKWIPEVWEGTRVGGQIYVNIRPKRIQFRTNENPFKVKLGYHGIVLNAMNAPNVAPIDRARPFQFLYFVVMHKMKEILAADKAPLINIDMSLIPKNLSKEQYMHYLNMGINFYDPNQNTEGGKQLSGQKVTYETQRSTLQHVINYINILHELDEQIGEVMGITRQREGQTNAAESVTGTQTAIVQSNNLTEPLFLAHNLLWERILTSVVEVASKIWKDNKKVPYLLDDLSRDILELTPDTFANSDIGVFITDSSKDNEIFQYMRQLAQPMMQNGAKISDVISLLQATSVEAYKREIKKLEAVRDQMAAQQQQSELQAQQQLEELKAKAKQDEFQHDWEMQERKYEHEKELKAMDVYKMQKDLDVDKNGIPDPIEAAELQHKINIEERSLNLEERRLSLEAKQHEDSKTEAAKDRKIKEKEVAVKAKAAAKKPSSTSKK